MLLGLLRSPVLEKGTGLRPVFGGVLAGAEVVRQVGCELGAGFLVSGCSQDSYGCCPACGAGVVVAIHARSVSMCMRSRP